MESGMAPERWRLVEEILNVIWDAPPEHRDVLLLQRCGSDAELLSDVQALLDAGEGADNWQPSEKSPIPREREARRLGPYRLERLIARGGMGAVYLAHRADEAFDQKVAIKVIGLPFESELFRERFRRERQILAGLNHPNITHLLDGGLTSDGELYLAMEYVEGLPLDEYCRLKSAPIAERLQLFRLVCGAVTYAHQNLIIHRDIKPSNILVSVNGTPKLLDFGTAKLLADEPEIVDITRTGMSPVTAAYASPEQLRGEPASTQSDVYSLGVVLYELISGVRAFGPDVMSRLDPGRALELPVRLPGDLELIARKALAPEPADRYVSVEQFAEDIRRHLEGEPVLAHPTALLYRARKFVRRHAIAVVFSGIFIVGLAAAAGLSVWQVGVARRQAARAESINAFLNQMLSSPNPSWYNTLRNKGKNVTVLEVIDEMRERIATEFAGQPEVEVELRRTIGRMYSVLGQHPEARNQLQLALHKQLTSVGRDQPETARIYVALAGEDYFTQRFAAGIENARAALAILQRKPRQEDRQVLMEAYNALAISLHSSGGQPAEVKSAMQKSLSLSRELFGNGGSTPVDLGVLATFETQQGNFDDATKLATETLDLIRASAGKLAGDAFPPLRDLGTIAIERQDYAAAEKYLLESREIAGKQTGPDSPHSIGVRMYLALAIGLAGRTSEAEQELNTCMRLSLAVGGSAHLRLARAKELLARVQMHRHAFDLAETNLRDALATYRQLVPSADPRITTAEGYLGECLLARGKREEALPLLNESYQRSLTAFGPTHVWTQQAKARLDRVIDRRLPQSSQGRG